MRIILVEFPWQTEQIINYKSSFREDVIVSLDAESSYILKTNKIKYFETYQFCNHKELWLKYKEITARTIEITKVLDKALWSTDQRFKDLNWKFFNDYHYPIKISFDQLFYYSELISALIEKFNPSEIIVVDTKEIIINNHFLIHSKISVIKYLLKTFKGSFTKIKIRYILPDQNKNLYSIFYSSLKKITHNNFKDFLKKIILNNYYKINFLINYYTSKPKYLAINCQEILRYKKLYPNESKLFLSYSHKNLNTKKFIDNSVFFTKFVNFLEKETDFYELINHKNINFKFIFNEILFKLIKQRDFLLSEYNKAKKIINRIKPACVIFQTTTHYYSSNITFRKSCIDLKIPFITWAHGGFGFNYSLMSYDVTDFRFCKNYISYGQYLNDLINDKNCVLNQLGFQNNLKIFSVGSAKFDFDNRKKKLENTLKKNKKQTILFFTGNLIRKNKFYFGNNREKSETSLWEFQYDILYLFKKFQNKYNIIFKDYSDGKKNLWKKILKDIKADKILYISDEYNVNELLRISDLNVMPWIRTTFFEALYFNADIFAIEEDIFEKPLEGLLKDEFFCFKDSKNFLLELNKYLEDGNFYKKIKTNSKNYFLGLNNLNKRDQLLNNTLSKIN